MVLISASLVAAYVLRPAPTQLTSAQDETKSATPDETQNRQNSPSGEIYRAPELEAKNKQKPLHLSAQQLETALASPAGLSLRAAQRESATEADFERLLTTLHDGYHGDPEAGETQRLFERQIGTAFGASDTGIALDRIACGLSICAAKFTGRQTASMKFLGTLMDSGQGGNARIYSSNIQIAPAASGDNRVGYRVIFSTDPATATLIEQR